jgi:hypothetical protein
VDTARIIINPSISTLDLIEAQLNQIKLLRTIGVFILLAIIILLLYPNGNLGGVSAPTLTNTPYASYTNTVRPNTPVSNVSTQTTLTPTALLIITNTPSPTPTVTTLGIGYVSKALITVWDNPNGKFVDRLGLYQIVTILDIKDVSGSIWLKCSWEFNAVISEGWILSEYIVFGTPPTQQP